MSREHVLDLTLKQVLFELAIEEAELLGRKGAKLLSDLRERAWEAEYTHVFYRDPLRPGIVWSAALGPSGGPPPARGKLKECREVAQAVFPGFLETLREGDEAAVMASIPPLSPNVSVSAPTSAAGVSAHDSVASVSALDLVTALEYLVFSYPGMVRAWAALLFAYGEILGMRVAADAARAACAASCPHAQVVAYFVSL